MTRQPGASRVRAHLVLCEQPPTATRSHPNSFPRSRSLGRIHFQGVFATRPSARAHRASAGRAGAVAGQVSLRWFFVVRGIENLAVDVEITGLDVVPPDKGAPELAVLHLHKVCPGSCSIGTGSARASSS